MKIVKKSWIAILALATAIVAACTATKRMAHSKDEMPPADDTNKPDADNNLTEVGYSIDTTRAKKQKELENLRIMIREREMSCVYGSPEVIREYSAETWTMRHQADSLQNEIMKDLESQRSILEERLRIINETIDGRSGAKVYGSPETINKYKDKNRELYERRDSVEKAIFRIDTEINSLNNKDSNTRY